jgi:DNA-binding GntR family transcriptional regulator
MMGPPDGQRASAKVEGTSVECSVDAIRQLILDGEYLPGQILRHMKLAEQLGTSRTPVREALKKLEADGVVTYVPRIGHAVSRFSSSELSEIYLMRRLLEAKLLQSADLSMADTNLMTALNEDLAGLKSGDLRRRKQLNREFHFHLFDLSPLVVVC